MHAGPGGGREHCLSTNPLNPTAHRLDLPAGALFKSPPPQPARGLSISIQLYNGAHPLLAVAGVALLLEHCFAHVPHIVRHAALHVWGRWEVKAHAEKRFAMTNQAQARRGRATAAGAGLTNMAQHAA